MRSMFYRLSSVIAGDLVTLFRFAYRTERRERSCRNAPVSRRRRRPDSNLRVLLRVLSNINLGVR
jgi:hypothetical protein